GGRDRFALESLWRTFAVPALIQLTESINDMFVKTKPFGEALRHLAVTHEHRLDVRGGQQAAPDSPDNIQVGIALVLLQDRAHEPIQNRRDIPIIDPCKTGSQPLF